jgi:hypothetical protein
VYFQNAAGGGRFSRAGGARLGRGRGRFGRCWGRFGVGRPFSSLIYKSFRSIETVYTVPIEEIDQYLSATTVLRASREKIFKILSSFPKELPIKLDEGV